MSEFTKIENIEQLKQLFDSEECGGACGEFFIQCGAFARSWKTMYYDAETDNFYILNQIDESEQFLSTEELFDPEKTNIGVAINSSRFYFAWS